MALPTASDNPFPSLLITEGTEPSAPASGKQRVYIDSTSHHLSRTNSSGNEVDLEPVTASSSAQVTTSQTTASATYTDLGTTGPAATVIVPASGKVLIIIGAELANSATGISIMGVAISGATTTAAPAQNLFLYIGGAGGTSNGGSWSRSTVLTSLTPGSTTFTAKYKSTAGTGTFGQRDIFVMPLP
jgi:hypothetical protein